MRKAEIQFSHWKHANSDCPTVYSLHCHGYPSAQDLLLMLLVLNTKRYSFIDLFYLVYLNVLST